LDPDFVLPRNAGPFSARYKYNFMNVLRVVCWLV